MRTDKLNQLSIVLILALWALLPVRVNASVALLMEEPFGTFGAVNPTGHAAIYLNHVCADTYTRLRPCEPGEYGVVISRYHKIHGYDWIAVPLVPYLYAVDTPEEVPDSVTPEQEANLRDAYRREHLLDIAPDDKRGRAPKGEWIQLIGSSYDRTIHGFEVTTTAEQDDRFIALFNDRKDISHFNLFFHNCADFSRVVLNTYMPDAIHRNFIADAGLTTPKQVARSLVKYGRQHPELELSTFVIPQVPGTVKRSHPVDGVAESLVKSKKYLLPLVLLHPAVTAGVAVAYLMDGRMKLPKDPEVFDLGDAVVSPTEIPQDTVLASGGGGVTAGAPKRGSASMR